MNKFVLSLYQALGTADSYELIGLTNKTEEFPFIRKLRFYPIVATNEDYVNTAHDLSDRLKLEKEFKLRFIELEQTRLDLFIKNSANLHVQIKHVEFTFDIDDELMADFTHAIETRNGEKAFRLMKMIREENIDIKAISFIYHSELIRLTKFGKLEICGNDFVSTLKKVERLLPLHYILGLQKFPK